jgi:hypothetical protein
VETLSVTKLLAITSIVLVDRGQFPPHRKYCIEIGRDLFVMYNYTDGLLG